MWPLHRAVARLRTVSLHLRFSGKYGFHHTSHWCHRMQAESKGLLFGRARKKRVQSVQCGFLKGFILYTPVMWPWGFVSVKCTGAFNSTCCDCVVALVHAKAYITMTACDCTEITQTNATQIRQLYQRECKLSFDILPVCIHSPLRMLAGCEMWILFDMPPKCATKSDIWLVFRWHQMHCSALVKGEPWPHIYHDIFAK